MEVGDEGDVDGGVGGIEGGCEHGGEGGQQGVGQGEPEHLEGDKEVDKEEDDHDGVPGPRIEREESPDQAKGDCSAKEKSAEMKKVWSEKTRT